LAGIRDEVVDAVMVRKHNSTLNFGFGTLHLRHNGTVEFKSQTSGVNVAEQDTDKIPVSAEFDQNSSSSKRPSIQSRQPAKDTQSQQSITERSLHFMQ